MKRQMKYTIILSILLLIIEITIDCFTFNNVLAQDTPNGQYKIIKMEAALEMAASNECVEHEYECKNEKEATCSDEGFKILKCINCSFSYKEIIPAGHNYMPTLIDATCSQMGYTLYTCSYCNDSYKDHYTPISGHQYMPYIIKAATYYEEGITEYRCIYCDDSYEEIIPVVGHSFQETVVEATCSEEGYTLHVCKYCNRSYKDHYTPVRAHQYISHIKKEASCNEEGVKEYRCIYCNDFYEEMIPALEHSYRETVVEATCSEGGYTLHTCENCHRSYKDHYTPIRAHKYISDIKKEATCDEEGVKEYRCIYCNDFYEEIIPAIGHSYEETVIEATCSKMGYTLHICKNCNHSYKDHYTSVRAHKYISDIKKEATCEKKGVKEYRCIYCDDFYEKIIPASGHDYKETVIEATCSKGGYTLHTCKNCNHSYKDHYTPIRVHKYISDIIKDAACEEEGVEKYHCIYCNDSYEKAIPALGHEYGDWFIQKEATPTEEGSRYKICRHNSNHIIRETIPYTYPPPDTKEKTKETKNTEDNESEVQEEKPAQAKKTEITEVNESAVQEGKSTQVEEAETAADITSEKNVQTTSGISLPWGNINAMDVLLTALITLSIIGLAIAIMGDVRVIIWDMKLRAKHKK